MKLYSELAEWYPIFSAPEAIDFESEGRPSHAFFHAPKNKDVTAPSGSKPPLIVFRATLRSSRSSRAAYTTPMPPSPSLRAIA